METLAEEAQRAQDEGHLELALSKWKLLAESPDSQIYLLKYGRVAQSLERWQDAEDAYSKAMEISVSSFQLELMGSLWTQRTDKEERSSFETAKDFFQQALARKRSARLLTQLGAVHVALDGLAAATEAFEQALLLDENYEEAMYNLAILRESANPEEAKRLLERAVEIDTEYGLAHQTLGRLYHKKRDLDKAEYHFRRCLEIDPCDYWSKLYLANLLAVRGLREEAKQEFEEAIALQPEIEGGRNIYANFLDRIGKHDGAAAVRRMGKGEVQ